MATPHQAEPVHLSKLRRFLYVGHEECKYFPGNWRSQKYFERTRLDTVMTAILEADPTCQAVCDIILKTYKDGLYSRYDTIAFALCICLIHGNDTVKLKIYKLAEEVCRTPIELFTFVYYTRKLKTGFGNGWCRTVRNWYRNKPPMELAVEVAKVLGHLNQKHVNLMRKSHVKLEEGDHARDSIVKYVMYGIKQAQLLHSSHASAAPVLAYIQQVEDLRHCEDPVVATISIREHNFTLEHVPAHLLTSQEVWEAVLPNMPLKEVLSSLLRVHNMGFLGPNSTTAAVLESILTNGDIVRSSKVTPLEVFIALKSYTLKRVPIKKPKAKFMEVRKERRREKQHQDPVTLQWVWDHDTPKHPREHKYWGMDTPVNPVVESALSKTLELSWPSISRDATLRYLITLDVRDHMFKGRHFCETSFKPPKKDDQAQESEKRNKRAKMSAATPAAGGDASSAAPPSGDKSTRGNKRKLAECFHYTCVTPGDAALVTALSLWKREPNATLAVFTENGIRIANLPKKREALTMDKLKDFLRKAGPGRVRVDAPIEWANSTKQEFDVFINIIDRQTRYMELDKPERLGRGEGGGYGDVPPPEGPDHCPVRNLERYREELQLPKARLITMSLGTHRVNTPGPSSEGVLDIVGIDEHVPKLIDAFAAGHFD